MHESVAYDTRRLLEECLAIGPTYARAATIVSFTHHRAYTEPYDDDYLSPAALDAPLNWPRRRWTSAPAYRTPAASLDMS